MVQTALLFSAALLVRGALLGYGAWMDANFKLKYTDVDYFVFTDAARFMAAGQSPYLRATYRYTPLLALLLQVNLWHPVAGKLLFAGMDLVVGYCLLALLSQPGRRVPHPLRYVALFLFNPVVVNVSTRGNADCLVVFLVVATLYLVVARRLTAAAVMYGLAVHTKLYPIVFALALALYIGRTQDAHGGTLPAWRLIFRRDSLLFAVTSAGVFAAVTYLCYHWYGWPFLHETYLYHFGRTDNRHNLSPYFYDIYLSLAASAEPSLLLKVLAFIPQCLVLFCTSLATYSDLPLCLFLLSHVFVIFNKVCTVQYFVWYLALLPPRHPPSPLHDVT
eukprot:EG_transcript_9832